jgi:transposase
MHEETFNLLGIPPEDWTKTPESVRLALLSLLQIVREQSAQQNLLQSRVKELEAKLGKTSQNSSKPPSSDPPSAPPKPPKVPRGRKAGAQPGHEGHSRPLAPPERVDEPIDLLPERCSHCPTVFSSELATVGAPRRTQVWELPELRPHITEYRQHSRCCPACSRLVTAELPPDAPPGALGPRATALLALLRSEYRLSLDETVEFFAEVCNLPISPGCVVTSCGRASEAVAPVDAAIHAHIHAAPEVNADETSWKLLTKRGWLWVAVASGATCFRLHQSRGHDGLKALLGEPFRGIVTSDRYTSYGLLAIEQRQLCWAHLLRDLRGLDEQYGEETGWARRALAHTDELFLAWQLFRGGWLDRVGLQQALLPARHGLRTLLEEGVDSRHDKIAAFSKQLLRLWEALWTFSRVEGVEPTNNAAERALRHAVLWRKGCFGSRSEAGCRFVERLLSVRATCAQQGRKLFAFLTETIAAAWAGRPAPLLVAVPASA